MIKEILNKFFPKKKYPIKDLTSEDINPISLAYLGHGKKFLFKINLEDCVFADLMAFRGGFNSNSPIIKTIIDYEKGQVTKFNKSKLYEMYNNFKPRNAAEYLGLENPYYEEFKHLDPAAAPWPWSTGSPKKTLEKRKKTNQVETGENGEGDKFFGPVSRSKGKKEYSRYIKIYKKIKNEGVKINYLGNGNIKGFFLVSKKSSKITCVIKQGHHRLAALSALGYTHTIIQNSETGCGSVVRREDVLSWPAVRNGYFSRKEALYIFDRLLAGEQPYSYYKIYK